MFENKILRKYIDLFGKQPAENPQIKELGDLYRDPDIIAVIKNRRLKNILTKRKESDTYLATVGRHRWSPYIKMKIDEM